MEKKKVLLSGLARLELYKTIQNIRPGTYTEQRANNRVYNDFGLVAFEEIIQANIAPPGAPQDKIAASSAKIDAEITVLIEAPPAEFEISEWGAKTLHDYLDRLKELFPAGEAPNGQQVPAGLPMQSSRKLAPLVEAVEAAFPSPEPDSAAK